jgi:hypothetical protein
MKNSTHTLHKIKNRLLNDPAIPLLGYYILTCEYGYSKDTCTSMFIAALFTIVKQWKQARCPTTDENEYLYKMEFYLVIKENEILSFAGKWMELKNTYTHARRACIQKWDWSRR